MVAQTLEYVVRLRDMLPLVGFIEFDLDMIEREGVGVDVVQAMRFLLFDLGFQMAHRLCLIDIDRKDIDTSGEEAPNGV